MFPYFIIVAIGCSSPAKKPAFQDTEMSAIAIPDIHLLSTDQRLYVRKDGLVEYNDILYSGYLESFFRNGQLKLRQGYIDGRPEGEHIKKDSTGQFLERRFYMNGEKHGNHTGWYPNGQKRFDYLFVQGRSEGCHRKWRENGDLWQEFNFEAGSQRGLQRVWRSDGKLRANYVVRENGRRYGMQGIKRCENIDTKKEQLSSLTQPQE